MQFGQLHHALVVIDESLNDLFGLQVALVADQVLDIAHLHLGNDARVEPLAGGHGAAVGHLRAGNGHVVVEARQGDGDGQGIH